MELSNRCNAHLAGVFQALSLNTYSTTPVYEPRGGGDRIRLLYTVEIREKVDLQPPCLVFVCSGLSNLMLRPLPSEAISYFSLVQAFSL